jgi:cellulose synthase (UDP-forming)
MERRRTRDRRKILAFRTPETPAKFLLFATLVSAIFYFYAIAFLFERGNFILFWVLILGEIFHVWMAMTYIHTIWGNRSSHTFDADFAPEVDVFITVAGEPVDVVEQTARAAKAMDYPSFNIYILNDGLVAKKDNWQEIEALARRLRIKCITRSIPGGAKSGNVNNGLRETNAPLVVLFDADHVPNKNFLKRTVGYFTDPTVGFVQVPQYYGNRDENYITAAAWEQQELFFGAIAKGKDRTNSMFMCGTNMVIRRAAIEKVGGMAEDNIAEDFLTALFIHQKGWKSVYVPEVLSEGLAPQDLLSYFKQQHRWARGSLEVVFRHNPFLKKGLTLQQKIEYLASASYHLNGLIVLLNAAFPLVFFFTGEMPFQISTMTLAAAFLPYIFLMMYVLQRSSNSGYTFRALAFSMSGFPIHIKALWDVLTGAKSGFHVTSKTRLDGNFLRLVIPHISYIVMVVAGIAVAFIREGLSASLMNNTAWALFNVSVFIPMIYAALPRSITSPVKRSETAAAFGASYEMNPLSSNKNPGMRGAEDVNYISYDDNENI